MWPVRHVLPVGEQPARGLAAAFDDVAGQAATRQRVVIGGRPAKGIHQHAQRHRRIDAAAGDDDLRTRVQRGLDRQRAQVGVGGQHPGRQRRAALQLAHRRLGAAQLVDQRAHVVARDHGDLHRHAQFGRQRAQRVGATFGVDAAGVADDADAMCHHVVEHAAHRHRDETGGVAQLGLFQPRASQDRHGEFGQVVEHQKVDLPAGHQLRRADAGVAPEARGAANAHGARGRRHGGIFFVQNLLYRLFHGHFMLHYQ